MQQTSLSLLNRLRNPEDREAWSRLLEVYSPLLSRWLQRFDVQPADAEDIIQDVLLTVVREIPSFEHSSRVGAFRSWLRTALVHQTQSFWRKRNKTQLLRFESQLRDLASETSGLSQLWRSQHDRHVVAKLLERVRSRFEDQTWEAFQRQMFKDEQPEEIASSLGVSLSSVYVAKSRVLRTLRAESVGLVDDASEY